MTQNLNWLSVTINHPPACAEALSNLLFELGAQALWEDLPDPQGRLVSKAGFAPDQEDFLKENLPAHLANVAEAFDFDPMEFTLAIQLEVNHDWAEKWKEGLEPIVVQNRLIIAPTWWTEPLPLADMAEGYVKLDLDPGLAFGSGHHATTFLCLWSLAEFLNAGLSPRRILDVGAGSGILSIAAVAMFPKAQEVAGLDNDPDTVDVAYENAGANGLAGRLVFSARPIEENTPGYDLILANITQNPLLELAGAITGAAAVGARLVMSGLVTDQAETLIKAYSVLGWGLQRHLKRDEWAALIFIKGAPAAASAPETV